MRPVPRPASPAPSAARFTRERILDEAERLFAERGFAGTSVRDIASRAGLTAGSLYNHFPGKEALYRAVLARGIEPLAERLSQMAEAEEPSALADSIIQGMMEHLAQHPHVPRLIVLEATTGGEHLAAIARDLIAPLVAQARAAMERGRSRGGSGWSESEQPLAIAAWLQLVFGHFALAPLLRAVFDRDPLSPEGVAEQTRFLRKLAGAMAAAAAAAEDETA